MNRTKYVHTKEHQVIVFGEALSHDSFRHLNIVSAGFISFGVNSHGNPICRCYGESTSLGLNSDPGDTRVAMYDIIGCPYSEFDYEMEGVK